MTRVFGNPPERFAVLSEEDSYRNTEPMGRAFDGRVPQYIQYEREFGREPYVSGAWAPPLPSDSVPRETLRPKTIRYSAATDPDIPTPPQPLPTEPFIAQMVTARNTAQIARELRSIRWTLMFVALAVIFMLFCEIVIAERLSSILSSYQGQF